MCHAVLLTILKKKAEYKKRTVLHRTQQLVILFKSHHGSQGQIIFTNVNGDKTKNY
jgi:hypothetical protein